MRPWVLSLFVLFVFFLHGTGLSVTAVLVLVVGFRLRSLKRHLRGRIRNGGVARDADYLVNGMYL